MPHVVAQTAAPRQRWEGVCDRVENGRHFEDRINETIRARSPGGWEQVALTVDTTQIMVCFKRPAPQ